MCTETHAKTLEVRSDDPFDESSLSTEIGETLQQVFSTGFVTEGEYSDKFEQAIENTSAILTFA